jgi:hypothetical protein
VKADARWTDLREVDRHSDVSYRVVGVADEVDVHLIAPDGRVLRLSIPRLDAVRLATALVRASDPDAS